MASFEDLLAELRRFTGPYLAPRIAEKGAEEVKSALIATLNAGTDPEGNPWAPGKASGQRVYVNAAAALEVKATGDFIRATITGPEVWGHFGLGKQQAPRPMLPDSGGGTPKSVDDALAKAAQRVLDEITK